MSLSTKVWSVNYVVLWSSRVHFRTTVSVFNPLFLRSLLAQLIQLEYTVLIRVPYSIHYTNGTKHLHIDPLINVTIFIT